MSILTCLSPTRWKKKGAYDVRVVVEKGKKIMQKKFRVRPPAPRILNTNLNLEKQRVFVSSEEDDSSSSSDISDRIIRPFGECSKMAQVDNGLRNGMTVEGPTVENGSSDEGSGPSFNGPVYSKERNEVGEGSVLEEGQRQHPPAIKDDAIHLEVDLGLLGVISERAVKENVAAEASNQGKNYQLERMQ
ncbi:hypothetical protein Q3G72_033659 [Acer saccharum]|nr:hypothetical protein Q3G72_033659 [Acer saccharum]